MAHIRFVVNNLGGTPWYRANVPGRALRELGHDVALDLIGAHAGDTPGRQVLGPGGVLVAILPQTGEALSTMRAAKDSGALVVADVDDDPWSLTERSPRRHVFTSSVRATLEQALSEADLLTTPSAHLARQLDRFGPPVIELPNCISATEWPNPRPASRGQLVVGWAGGDTHAEDLALLDSPLQTVAERHPSLRIAATGLPGHEKRGPWPSLRERTDLVPYERVENLLVAISRFDIGLAPLLDTAFNRSKSDLKLLEYSAAAVPAVCSPVAPYVKSIDEGAPALAADSDAEWVDALERLLTDQQLRTRTASRARRWAETRFIENNVGLWLEAYGLD